MAKISIRQAETLLNEGGWARGGNRVTGAEKDGNKLWISTEMDRPHAHAPAEILLEDAPYRTLKFVSSRGEVVFSHVGERERYLAAERERQDREDREAEPEVELVAEVAGVAAQRQLVVGTRIVSWQVMDGQLVIGLDNGKEVRVGLTAHQRFEPAAGVSVDGVEVLLF